MKNVNESMALLLAEYSFNKSELARAIGHSPQSVSLAYDKGFLTSPMALKIERITNGKFKAVDLCKHSL